MKIRLDLTINIQLPSGDEVKFQGQPLSFRQVLKSALMAEHESDRDSPLEVRVYRMDMMASIHEQGSVDLTLYDVAILSELVRRTFPHPSVVVAFLAAMNKALDTPKPELDNV